MNTSDFTPPSSKEFLDIQATIECGFTLKRVRGITRTYSHSFVCITTTQNLRGPGLEAYLIIKMTLVIIPKKFN